MRGQKSRSGSGTRPGFQGGQTPLYRQMPKLKGIAGGARTRRLHALFGQAPLLLGNAGACERAHAASTG